MIRKIWGRNGQVRFASAEEYYRIIGYLARSKGETELTWEHNEDQGAWGSEGRIHFFNSNKTYPSNFSYTKGRGNIIYRVNCNDFVEHLNQRHKFVAGKYQNEKLIRSTIPQEYICFYEEGLQGMPNKVASTMPSSKPVTVQPKVALSVHNKVDMWWTKLTVGDVIVHKKFGVGAIVSLGEYVVVKFADIERKFLTPFCFEQGFFTKQ